MPKHPIFQAPPQGHGCATPRCVGRRWRSARQGWAVWEMPAGVHAALLRPGLFDLDAVAAHEEADFVVRYWLHGFDWSPIAPRGSHHCGPVALHRAEIRRTARRGGVAELHSGQRGMIPTIGRRLDRIAVGYHEQGLPFPAPLADWAIQRHLGGLRTPPTPRGDQGRPAYAQANRNLAIAEVFNLLGYLGLHGKLVRCSVIAEELKCTEDAVRKALATHARCWTGALPRPWECWPPPRRKSPSPR